jgi:hypothetical protein
MMGLYGDIASFLRKNDIHVLKFYSETDTASSEHIEARARTCLETAWIMSETNPRLGGIPGMRLESPFEERRQWPRSLVRDVRGSMSWRGEAGDVACEVSVLNISGGGAAVLGEDAPPEGQTLRLVLHCESARMDAVEAVALGASVHSSGKQLIRLRFAHWMPLDAILEKHRERRMWERYPARELRSTLTWLDGPAEVTIHGELLNISGGGVAFVSDVLPPPGTAIWLQLMAGIRQVDRADPVESKLVTTSTDPLGRKIAHIQFVDPCPMDLFELAVNGSR